MFKTMPNARVVVSTDGTNRAFIDAGDMLIPVSIPTVTVDVYEELTVEKPIPVSAEASRLPDHLTKHPAPIIAQVCSHLTDGDGDGEPDRRIMNLSMQYIDENGVSSYVCSLGPSGTLVLSPAAAFSEDGTGEGWVVVNLGK